MAARRTGDVMRPSAVTIDPRFREHDPGVNHPERPDRVAVLEELVAHWSGPRLERVAPRLADECEIRAAHSAELLDQVRATQGQRRCRIDADTATSERSYETALLAAGGLVELTDAVATGVYRNGFAFVRPPGHHATATQAMGFCLFNNAAVAARHLRAVHGYERIAIVDWDLHHGNGTEAIFWEDPSVLYVSLHQYPYYPGTGAASDVGRGAGAGFTINVPFSAGVGDAGFLLAFEQVIEPVLRRYAPQFILVSAGFDAHHRDPLGGLQVTEQGYREMARRLLAVADDVAEGRIVAVLEGGYDLDAIRQSTEAVLTAMASPLRPIAPLEIAGDPLEPLKRLLAPYWHL
jgi:acetoin utilization deacetylase AcuC-like enzyme